MKKLHTYTRILLSLLLMLVTNVVMGQEVNIPIRTISAVPNKTNIGHDDSHDHSINNLGDKENAWIADQPRAIQILNYLQLTNVDKTASGTRTWIEIPYVPNQNTSVEVTFQNPTSNPNPAQYIYGCGNPGKGSGMAMWVNTNGKLVNSTSNNDYEDGRGYHLTDKLTYILSTAGIQQRNGYADPTMLFSFPSSDNNVISESKDPAKYKNLCFFANPGDDNSMSYEGKIFGVKVYENGKLRFELQPATENGIPGFYDRISTDFYPITTRVAYVENTSVNSNVHIKVPLSQSTEAAQNGYEWSNSLVKNGYLMTDNFSSFQKGGDDTALDKVTLSGVTALRVTSGQRKSQDWDSQLFLVLDEPLQKDDKYYISFDYRAADGVTTNVSVQAHSTPGTYNNNFLGGSISFTPEWQHGTWTGTVTENQAKNGGLGAIALLLNVKAEPTYYYITNVVIKKQERKPLADEDIPTPPANYSWSRNLVQNGDFQTDNLVSFAAKWGPDNGYTIGNGSYVNNALEVVSQQLPKDEKAWYSQMFIKLDEPILAGERYYISFEYCAEKATLVPTQAHHVPGTYNADNFLGNLSFGTSWKKFATTGVLTSEQGKNEGMGAIAFNLNTLAASNKYYLRNVVVKKVESNHADGKQWSGNLITNGAFTGTNTNTSFGSSNADLNATDSYLKVKSGDYPSGGNAYSSQLFIKTPTTGDVVLKSGDTYEISFQYKADAVQTVNTYFQYTGEGQDDLKSGGVSFGTDWQTFSQVSTVPNTNKTLSQLAFHLYTGRTTPNTFYFKNVVIRKLVDAPTTPTEPTPDSGKKWSKSLVKNGSFTNSDLSSFDGYHKTASIDDEHDVLQVVSEDRPTGEQEWYSQFFIIPQGELIAGDKCLISFSYRAENDADTRFVFQWKEGGENAVGDNNTLHFNTGWNTFNRVVTIPEGKSLNQLCLKLSVYTSQNKYYLKDVVIKKQVPDVPEIEEPTPDLNHKWSDSLVQDGSFSASSLSASFHTDGTDPSKVSASIETKDGRKALHVISGTDDSGNTPHHSQLHVVLDEPLQAGDKYYVSFDYKADTQAYIPTEAHSANGFNSWGLLKPEGRNTIQFTTEWQTAIFPLTVKFEDARNGGLKKIVFNLNGLAQSNDYYFANFVVKKQVPAESEKNPARELKIKYKNLDNTNSGTHYLFSLGTHEEGAMAVSTSDGNYRYSNGKVISDMYNSNDNNSRQRITKDDNVHELTLQTGGFKIDNSDFINISGTPVWEIVDALYLMGAHCDPANAHTGLSFNGQIYEVTLTENGIKRLDLFAANENGEYGFIDKLTKKFYGKDGCSDIALTGPSTCGYDVEAVKKYEDGNGIVKRPFKIDFTTDLHVPGSLCYTTANRESGEYDINANNPKEWVLYASTDGTNWKKLTVTKPNSTTVPTEETLDTDDATLQLVTNGVEYTMGIDGNTEAFSRYRLVVEQVITPNSDEGFARLRMAGMSLTTKYSFEHYHGRVYDSPAGKIPDNLQVGGTSGYKSEWKTSEDDVRLGSKAEADVQIQRTHEYEHVVYTLPNTTINLTPFSDFADTGYTGSCYQEQYIRWYDYTTDQLSSQLQFDPLDGRSVNALDMGHFAWNLKDNGRRTREGAVAKYTAPEASDNDGVFGVIALEAANDFAWEGTWKDGKYVIKEPTLQWRHTFVIKDAQARTDSIYDYNESYLKYHKITLMCPADVPFQYPLPCFEYAKNDAGNTTHATDYYLRSGSEDNYDYTAVTHYKIVTTTPSGTTYTTKVGDTVGSQAEAAYSYKPIDNYNRVFYMLKPQTVKEYESDGKTVKKETKGVYTIKIYALDSDNDDTNDVQLMEYELQVLPKQDGVMVLGANLYATDTKGKFTYDYPNQIPEKMTEAFGKPTTERNFDLTEKEVENDTELINGNRYFKWPWQWENSSYGFGYEDRGDYNMYMVADHMGITPFHGGSGDDMTGRDEYDRHYYDTGGKERGYFFYANAASDPSRMATLNIGSDFCTNTKVYVSAWINEFQGKNAYAETANVIFSFRGVDDKGNETVLNSFVSGYVPGGWNTPEGYNKDKFEAWQKEYKDDKLRNPDYRGQWMHVYYTFTTTEQKQNFDHYIITLENNCTSSEGADYAIDDIRCYVRKPKLEARLMAPVCNDTETTELELYGDFDLLYDAFTLEESSEDVTLKYCLLDREAYEQQMADGYSKLSDAEKTAYPTLESWRKTVRSSGNDTYKTNFTNIYTYAFNEAQLSADSGTTLGSLTLKKTYASNPEYLNKDANGNIIYNVGNKKEIEGVAKNIIFPCQATDAQIKPGKTYILAVVKSSNDDLSPTAFDIENACKSASDFKIPLPARIKIDGVPQSALSGDSYCANQRPEITIDMNHVKKGGEDLSEDEVSFDWYYGPLYLSDFQREQGYTRAYKTERIENTDVSYNATSPYLYLETALNCLRKEYPKATEDNVKDMTSSDAHNDLKANMIEYVQKMVAEGRLTLNKDKAFASAHLFGDNIYPAKQKEFYMTALPINPGEENVDFCVDPINVAIKINELTPGMKDGSEDVSYPATMQDVPLRIGLMQLKRAVIGNLSENTVAQLENGTPVNQLWVPLRAIAPVTEEGHDAGTTLIKSDDDMIYLVDSNDPQVRIDGAGAIPVEEAEAPLKGAMIAGQSYVMGKLMEIAADKREVANVCKLAFLENFKFREGYWYTIKFHFKQEGASNVVCPGDLVFTIKVVPEYQMWTGAVSRNWNDDRNWRRVTSDELLWPASRVTESADEESDFQKFSTYIGGDPREFIKGGKDSNQNDITLNTNKESFAPADFTKVIIPADAPRVPYMYNLRQEANKTSVQFTGAPAATNQLATAKPSEAILSEVIAPNLYNLTSLDLNGQTFVITDDTGMETLGVTHKASSRPNGVGEQDAFVVNSSRFTDDMHVYAKFTKIENAGVDGDVYTIQLCNADDEYFVQWGNQGHLNFQPEQNTIFALGLNGQYGQDGKNLGLWRVTQVGDGVTIQNVGRGDFLNPSEAKPSTDPVVCKLAKSFDTTGAGQICYLPTVVQYDMASVDGSTAKASDVACRPWYDHTCDQIHFNSGAAMMDQRYLYYNKAWCDIEVPVGTWQTVASPLMNIVAGDLYLPTASARQDTPLFEDIFYDAGDSEHPALNDRFAPAVFQRSWNKSNATVYKLGGGQRNVGIKLDWSHVYNDVNVRYGAGQGFSIKVDVSAMDEANQPAKAKFRFPKADTQYTYYNPGNVDGNKRTEIVNDGSKTADGADVQYGANSNAKRPGRLADLTGLNFQQVGGDNTTADSGTTYLLVGNPLMCWLDMRKFFEVNSNILESEYWTVDANGQKTALFTEDGWVSTTEGPQFLPPGVSFFVKLKQQNQEGQAGQVPSNSVVPVFDNTMMSYTQAELRQNGNDYDRPTNDPTGGDSDNNKDGSSNNAKTRSTNATMPQLHMTATDVSGRQSRALLMDGTMIQHEGVETLFDSNLKDDALLYTTKDGMAKTIASIAPGDTLPLAVSGARDEVRLSIEGVKDFDFDLFLIDSEEGTVEPLEGDVVLKQAASGVRYYIATRSKDDTEVEGDVNVPRVTAKDGYITVYAPATCEIETSAIYNTGGIRLDFAEHIVESHSVKLLPGIYIVHLLCDGKTYTYKLMLR